VRAVARFALDHGFTTIRDVGTEGAMYADVDLKHAIARGVVPGSRMFVATRAFAPTGKYPPTGFSWEIDLPGGVLVCRRLRHDRTRPGRPPRSRGYAWTEAMINDFTILVRNGMIPMQAIRSTTSVATQTLGQVDRLGSIQPGRLADIIATTGDPLRDIAALGDGGFVMQGGRITGR
jgi:imidazolonepropionase-like amidohydrolase